MVVVLVTWFLLYDLELSHQTASFCSACWHCSFSCGARQQSDDDIEAREIPTLTLPLAWLSFSVGSHC